MIARRADLKAAFLPVPVSRGPTEHVGRRREGRLASATHGEVAERSIAAVLKTADRKVPGFESLPLRQQFEREMAGADPAPT
jgi:hypothetical protein